MHLDITQLLQAAITLVSLLISSLLIPYVRTKLSTAKQEKLQKWVTVAVAAAEQIFSDSGMGKKKKEYVVNFLLSKGIVVDVDEVEAMIEAEVYSLTSGS